jgi:hypothetical protein
VKVATDGRVTYRSPSQGELVFGWSGPLEQDGDAVELGAYPRYDNPFAQVPFDSRRYEITADGATLLLDFDAGVRTTSSR